jgi:glycosyltransferase involved in cell wall biosynthesis
MTSLRVAIVTPALPFDTSHLGGAETYVKELSLELAKIGCDVTIFTGTKYQVGMPKNLKIVNLKMIDKPYSLFGHGRRFPVDLFFKINEVKVDIIHVHHLRTPLHIVAALSGKLKRVPVVLTDHGGGGLPFPRLIAQFPDAFITVSKYSAKYLQHYAPQKKAYIVYAGVDIARFNPNVESLHLRKTLNLKEDSNVILFVGRIMPHKGVDVFLKAISIAKGKLNKEHIVGLIVGPLLDYKYFKYLQSLTMKLNLLNNIIFRGVVSENALPMYYSLCDFVVVPSVQLDCFGRYHPHPELLSITSLEAMACGKPVIASNIGGVPEIVLNNVTGLLVERGDIQGLAKAICTLIEKESLRLQMSKRASAFVQRHFTWRSVAKRTILAYTKVLEEKNKSDYARSTPSRLGI